MATRDPEWKQNIEEALSDEVMTLAANWNAAKNISPAGKKLISERSVFIHSAAEWDALYEDVKFEGEAFGAVSLDLENIASELARAHRNFKLEPKLDLEVEYGTAKQTTNADDAPRFVKYIVIGTMFGRSIAIDLQALIGARPKTRETVDLVLPQSLRRLLLNPLIVKGGSNLDADLVDFAFLGIDVAPALDLQACYAQVRHLTLPEDDEDHINGQGVGMKLFVGAYGGDSYKPKGNPVKFYEWKTETQEARRYIRMDAVGIFAYWMRGLIRGAPTAKTLNNAMYDLFGKYMTVSIDNEGTPIKQGTYREELHLDNLVVVVPNNTIALPPSVPTHAREQGRERAERRQSTTNLELQAQTEAARAKIGESPPMRFPSFRAKRFEGDDLNTIRLNEEKFQPEPRVSPTKAKSKQYARSKKAKALSFHPPYRFHCYIDYGCWACSSVEHAKKIKKNLVCPTAVELTKRKVEKWCIYPYCSDPGTHTIEACADLMSRCLRCALRGHRADRCEVTDQAELITTFEKYADLCPSTSKRFSRPEWGIFPIVNAEFFDPKVETRLQFPLHYEELLQAPLDLAWNIVVLFNREVRTFMDVIDPAVPHGLQFTAPFDY